MSYILRRQTGAALIITLLAGLQPLAAQAGNVVDSLVRHALATSPRVKAVDAQALAARARISPAGARPDPMLMAGIQNLPLGRGAGAMAGPEPMTMKMVGLTQTIPYPGKISLRTRAARAEADVVDARAAIIRRDVRRDLLEAYYDLAATRMLAANLERQQLLANEILPATEARYVSGNAAQADILKARSDVAFLVVERSALIQQERTAIARLNAVLDQPAFTPPAFDVMPLTIPSKEQLPSLEALQTAALDANPQLAERRAMIAVQEARKEVARRERLPDFEVGLQYGQRSELPDMVTAFVAVPLFLQRGRNQDADLRAARFEVSAAEADLRAEENTVRTEVARLHASLERQQTTLAQLDNVMLPMAQVTFASVSRAYQSGQGDLRGVLDAMRSLFATEAMRLRTIAEYAATFVQLEAVRGQEMAR